MIVRNRGGWVFLQSLANFVRLGKLFQESREIISLLLSGHHRFKHARTSEFSPQFLFRMAARKSIVSQPASVGWLREGDTHKLLR